MWFLEGAGSSKGLLLTVGVEYVAGRKDCTILVQDDASISRKHSVITIQHDEAHMGDPSKISQAFLQDFSKYGTSVNGVKISGTVNLKNGDEILFGKNNSYYRKLNFSNYW
ncbi:hypothetical protein OS493_001655 [Desmophyllum pertusum]|uniref:FHA domain-containing protein n=1 Tax=Desmophyllum pertusum TaxID=174260 RepID=A0A9X0CZC3_9CNID|nr:hypothetical protein OS493_001655 [Desmophyllum pertusum]